MAAEIVFMALLGLIAGSFLSVVAHRVPLGESIVAPRSRCPNCGTQIAAYDNVPLFSYLALRGRCRHCDAKVPATYPLLEAGLAAVFVAILLRYSDDGIEIALGACLAATLATITLTDLEHRVIPNRVLIVAALVAVGLLVAGDRDALAEHAIAAAIAFAVLFLIAIVYPRGMGMGDVKLAGVMGLYLGKAVAPALLIGFAAGALFGLALIARGGRRRASRRSRSGRSWRSAGSSRSSSGRTSSTGTSTRSFPADRRDSSARPRSPTSPLRTSLAHPFCIKSTDDRRARHRGRQRRCDRGDDQRRRQARPHRDLRRSRRG